MRQLPLSIRKCGSSFLIFIERLKIYTSCIKLVALLDFAKLYRYVEVSPIFYCGKNIKKMVKKAMKSLEMLGLLIYMFE